MGIRRRRYAGMELVCLECTWAGDDAKRGVVVHGKEFLKKRSEAIVR